MNKVVLTTEVVAKLRESGDGAELCDDAGATVGYFVPPVRTVPADSKLYDWFHSQISSEELNRRRNEPGGRTTAEVLARLKAFEIIDDDRIARVIAIHAFPEDNSSQP